MIELKLIVTGTDESVPGVRTLTLADPDGGELASFTPGSHLMIQCGPVTNAYSLTGPAVAPMRYTVSVQRIDRERGGHGGSSWIHDELTVGESITVIAPRSSFAPVRAARRHLYLAAGIGITPIVSHVRSAVRWDQDFELLYLHRPGAGAYLDELDALAGARMRAVTDRHTFAAALGPVLGDQPIGTHLYLCGPPAWMDASARAAADAGWPPGRVQMEHFGVGALDPGRPFVVDISTTGERIPVPAGVSLLSALEQAGHRVPNLCRQGVCGECRLEVGAGRIEHRDLFLDEPEKAAGTAMMCCVSRAADDRIEIRL